jgi:ketosteroid isomerase-like protein
MTRKPFLLLFAGLPLLMVIAVACSGLSPTSTPTRPLLAPTSPIPATESLAQTFITTYEAKNAADWLALFSYEAVFMDNGNPTYRKLGVVYVRNEFSAVNYLFSLKNFSMKFNSHFVSQDGRFIALNATYYNTGKDGNIASVPMMIILEVKDGKIIREDDYYDSSPFY